MKKSIIILSSFLMITLVAGSVFAWGPGRGLGMMGSGYIQDCPVYGGQQNFNDLSKDQINKMGTLRQQFIDETYELRAAKFQKHQEIRMLMQTSEPDRAKLDKLSREITDLQQQIRGRQMDFQMEARKISPQFGMGQGFMHRGGRWSKGGSRGYGNGGCYYNN